MRRGYADTQLGQIHYTTWGAATSPALLLLPQVANSANMFRGLAEALQADYRLVVLEYPGSGWSDPLPDGTSFDAIAAAFFEAMEQLDIREFAVYGHHTGNKIAARMAAARPDRVSGLIFVGQSHSIVADNARRSGTVGKTKRKLLKQADAREAALVQWTDLFNRLNAKWWAEDLMRNIEDDTARAFTARKIADDALAAMSIPTLYRANFAYDLEHDLRTLQTPTLVVEIATPSEDALVGRQGKHLEQVIEHVQVVVMEEPDWHGNTMEHRAAELASLVRTFLKRS